MSEPVSRLDEMLSLCERLIATGQPVNLSEVCDDSALLPELQRRFEALQRFQGLAALTELHSPRPHTGPPGPSKPARPQNLWSSHPDLTILQPPSAEGGIGLLDTYRVLAVLGRDPFTVHLHATGSAGEVIIKALLAERAALPDQRQGFTAIARALAALKHPHLAPILEVAESRGVPYLVMPTLPGETLEARLTAPWSLFQAVRCARQLAEGLSAAHQAGLLHRAIQPANVWLLAPDDHALWLDTGIASVADGQDDLTHSGSSLKARTYLSPEQLSGLGPQPRSDLFGLGCLLYEMLSGQCPFTLAHQMALFTGQSLPPPPALPNVPSQVTELVLSLLAPSPQQRPATAQEVSCRLLAIENGLTETGL